MAVKHKCHYFSSKYKGTKIQRNVKNCTQQIFPFLMPSPPELSPSHSCKKKKKKTTASGHEILLMSILQMHHSELNKTIWNVTIKCKEESPINQKNVLHSKRTRSLQVRYYGSPSMMWPFDDTWKWQVDFKKHKYGPRKDILLKNLWKS